MPMNKSYNPSAGLSPVDLEIGWRGTGRHSAQNLVFTVSKREAVIYFIIYSWGQEGAGRAGERGRCARRRVLRYHISRGGRGRGSLCLPQTPPWTSGKRIAFLRPIDFLIFWHFLVASIPFLVFPSMSQKTKMSKQLRAEVSISCQSAVFPALSKRAPRGMPRAGKMTNYIIFSP